MINHSKASGRKSELILKKDSILKLIATHGYNVGFGAKKHFATYDIIEKVPEWIGFVSIAYGILSLKYSNSIISEYVPCLLTIFGVVSLYSSSYLHTKDDYEKIGKQLTSIYSKLQSIYYKIKESNEEGFKDELDSAGKLMKEFHAKYDKTNLFQ
jgi:hypothetical protein